MELFHFSTFPLFHFAVVRHACVKDDGVPARESHGEPAGAEEVGGAVLAARGLVRMRDHVVPFRFRNEAAAVEPDGERDAAGGREDEAGWLGAHGGGEVALGAGEGLRLFVEGARFDVGPEDQLDGLGVVRARGVAAAGLALEAQFGAVLAGDEAQLGGEADGAAGSDGRVEGPAHGVGPGAERAQARGVERRGEAVVHDPCTEARQ